MRNFILLLLFSFNTIGFVNAQSAESIIAELIHEFMSKVDAKSMHDRFWAEDLTYTSSSGSRHGKSTIMAGFNDEDRSNANSPTYKAEDLNIKVFGELAVVTFRLVRLSTDGNVQNYYNSGTFINRKGEWRVINWHATIANDLNRER